MRHWRVLPVKGNSEPLARALRPKADNAKTRILKQNTGDDACNPCTIPVQERATGVGRPYKKISLSHCKGGVTGLLPNTQQSPPNPDKIGRAKGWAKGGYVVDEEIETLVFFSDFNLLASVPPTSDFICVIAD